MRAGFRFRWFFFFFFLTSSVSSACICMAEHMVLPGSASIFPPGDVRFLGEDGKLKSSLGLEDVISEVCI